MKDSKTVGSKFKGVTINTSLQRTGNVRRLDEKGISTDVPVPAWVATTDYCWYTPALKYSCSAKYSVSLFVTRYLYANSATRRAN